MASIVKRKNKYAVVYIYDLEIAALLLITRCLICNSGITM